MAGKLGTALFLLLFVVAFGGVGVFASWNIGSTLTEAWRARDGVRERATVGEAKLHDSGDTFRAEGTYRYAFGGREYAGSRLGLSKLGGADNIDDWHHAVSERMQAARAAGRPITVWVDPDNPAQAVLDRDIRWGEILFMTPFALAFGGVGVGAFIAMVVVLRGKSFGKAASGGERAAPQSVSLAGRDAGGKPAGFLWVFAFFWNAMSWPIALLAVPEIVANGEWAGLLVLLFPLVGIGLLWAAIATTWAAWKARRAAGSPAPERPPARTPARTLPGSMAAQAARAMFDPGGATFRGGFGRTPIREMPIPSSLATVEESGGALTLRYSARRWLGPAIVLSLLGGVFTFVGVAMVAQAGLALGPLVAVLVGVAIDVAVVALLLNRLEVSVRQGRLDVKKQGLLGRREWCLSRGEVTGLGASLSHRINQRPYYALSALTAAGEQVPVGNAIGGQELADSLARRIARAFGLPATAIIEAGSAGEPQGEMS